MGSCLQTRPAKAAHASHLRQQPCSDPPEQQDRRGDAADPDDDERDQQGRDVAAVVALDARVAAQHGVRQLVLRAAEEDLQAGALVRLRMHRQISHGPRREMLSTFTMLICPRESHDSTAAGLLLDVS